MLDLQLITVDDSTCITANGKPITNVGVDNMYMSGDDNTFRTKNFGPYKS